MASVVAGKWEEGAFQYATPEELTEGLRLTETPGEFELIQSIHLRERGDYCGALRRSITALEVCLEAILRIELLKKYKQEKADKELKNSKTNFPRRLKDYQKLSGRDLPEIFVKKLEEARNLRNLIVHRGHSLTYIEREQANRSVDFAKFIFDWMENDVTAQARRYKRIAQKSLGLHRNYFPAEITTDGVVVSKLF